MEITEKLIDIEGIIASKNPALLNWIPRFIIRYIKKIVHQDAINGYIFKHKDKTGLAFVDAILEEFGVHIELSGNSWRADENSIAGADPLSCIRYLSSGRYIIVSNHPLGGLDGMAFMHLLGKVRPDIVFPVNDILMNVPGLKPLFIPINKYGKNTENIALIDQTFASDKALLFFPAGLVSRKHKGDLIKDLEWKKTFISKAKRYHRTIVPVYISGKNSNFFYNLSKFRSLLGIKANIEMFYLVDEMMKQKDKTLSLTFGEPIPWTTFDRSKTDKQWAEWVKQKVYQLNT